MKNKLSLLKDIFNKYFKQKGLREMDEQERQDLPSMGMGFLRESHTVCVSSRLGHHLGASQATSQRIAKKHSILSSLFSVSVGIGWLLRGGLVDGFIF